MLNQTFAVNTQSKLKIGDRVRLRELSVHESWMPEYFWVGMEGTVVALNNPMAGYTRVSWDSGFEGDSATPSITKSNEGSVGF